MAVLSETAREGRRGVTFRFLFAWYDLWIGAYWDRKARALYVLPLPCVGFVLTFTPPEALVGAA